jgi:hypothetical protein
MSRLENYDAPTLSQLYDIYSDKYLAILASYTAYSTRKSRFAIKKESQILQSIALVHHPNATQTDKKQRLIDAWNYQICAIIGIYQLVLTDIKHELNVFNSYNPFQRWYCSTIPPRKRRLQFKEFIRLAELANSRWKAYSWSETERQKEPLPETLLECFEQAHAIGKTLRNSIDPFKHDKSPSFIWLIAKRFIIPIVSGIIGGTLALELLPVIAPFLRRIWSSISPS